jgi:Tol biopolymer transport system component
VAVSIADMEEDVWIWDFGRSTLSRFTSDPGTDHYPAWMPDGRRLVFSSARDGGSSTNLYWQSRDGIAPVERLTTSPQVQQVTAVTPDGTSLIFQEIAPATGRDIMQLRLDADRRVEPLLRTRFDERNGTISPDGRWLAYESDSSGRLEVYVRPFPGVDANQWQVSTMGGTKPLWAPGGGELFYVASDGTLMAVPVDADGDGWNSGTPAAILPPQWTGEAVVTGRTYDVSPDGRRFLVLRPADPESEAASPVVVAVQNWFEELSRLVGGN